jgi:hypothetical protein
VNGGGRRETDQGDGPGENIREFLRDAEAAMDGLGPLIVASAKDFADTVGTGQSE